jgi:hypothetical protein
VIGRAVEPKGVWRSNVASWWRPPALTCVNVARSANKGPAISARQCSRCVLVLLRGDRQDEAVESPGSSLQSAVELDCNLSGGDASANSGAAVYLEIHFRQRLCQSISWPVPTPSYQVATPRAKRAQRQGHRIMIRKLHIVWALLDLFLLAAGGITIVTSLVWAKPDILFNMIVTATFRQSKYSLRIITTRRMLTSVSESCSGRGCWYHVGR